MARGKKQVAVIGAGTLGMSSALQLAQRGCEVTVIDCGSIACGSSGRSVGVVGTQHVDEFEILIRAHSLRAIRDWTKSGLQFNAIGYMRLGRSERDMELFASSVEIQKALGIATSRVIPDRHITRLVPHLNPQGIVGALFGPDDGFLDPYQMCMIIAKMVKEAGGSIRQDCRLLAAERLSSGYRLVTSEGSVTCDAAVNAAGPWAAHVALLLGQHLYLFPERHQAVTIHLSQPLAYTMPMIMDLVQGGTGTGLNVRHDRPGQLITEIHKVDGAQPEDPDAYDDQLDEKAKVNLAELLLERFPDLPGASFGRGWAGLYPKSADGRPYVGAIDPNEPDLVTAAGAGGYGIQLGPVIGQLAADWIIEGAPTSIPEAIRLCPTPMRNPPLPRAVKTG